MPGGWQESASIPRDASLAAWPAHGSGLAHRPCRPKDSASLAGVPFGATVQLEVVGLSKTCSASFPWVPWAALDGRETARHTYFKH